MTNYEDEEIQRLLKEVMPRVDRGLRHDLWPEMLRRLEAPRPSVPWYDWALIGLSTSVFLFFPQLILVFAYHL